MANEPKTWGLRGRGQGARAASIAVAITPTIYGHAGPVARIPDAVPSMDIFYGLLSITLVWPRFVAVCGLGLAGGSNYRK